MALKRKRKKDRQSLYDSSSYKDLQRRVAQAVRELREENGWTQEEAAAACEMSTRLIQRCEAGVSNLTLATLARICDGFGIKAEELFRRRE